MGGHPWEQAGAWFHLVRWVCTLTLQFLLKAISSQGSSLQQPAREGWPNLSQQPPPAITCPLSPLLCSSGLPSNSPRPGCLSLLCLCPASVSAICLGTFCVSSKCSCAMVSQARWPGAPLIASALPALLRVRFQHIYIQTVVNPQLPWDSHFVRYDHLWQQKGEKSEPPALAVPGTLS